MNNEKNKNEKLIMEKAVATRKWRTSAIKDAEDNGNLVKERTRRDAKEFISKVEALLM